MRHYVTGTVFLVVICIAGTLAAVDDADKKECMKMSKGLLKKMLKLYQTCNKELNMLDKTAQEYKDSLGCVIKCVMKKVDVLDADENISEATMKSKIEEHLPEKFRPHAHEDLMKCVKLHDTMDPKDPQCKTYMNLGNCMQEAFVDLCGEMPLI